MDKLTVKARVASARHEAYYTDKARKKYKRDDVRGYSVFLHVFEIDGKPVTNPDMQQEGRYYPDYLLVDLMVYADEEIKDQDDHITYLKVIHPLPIEKWDEEYSLDLSFSPMKSILIVECSGIHARLVEGKDKGLYPARAGKKYRRGKGQPERLADIIHRIDQPLVVQEYLPTMRSLNNPQPVNQTLELPAFLSNGNKQIEARGAE